MKKVLYKTAALMLALVCIFSVIPSIGMFTYADTVSDLKNKKSDLQSKSNEIQNQIKALEESKKDQEALAKLYKEKAANTKEQLDLVVSEIAELDTDIKEKENEIAQKEVELQQTIDLFEKRLRAIYMTGSTSQLELLLSADNLGDYLARSELMRNVTEADNALMDSIKTNMAEIEAAKSDIEARKATKETKKSDLQSLNSQYTKELAAINSKIADIEDESEELDDKSDEYKNAINSLDAQIQKAQEEAIKNNTTSSSSSGSTANIQFKGIFHWPLPNCYTVSSQFRTANRPTHNGIDISKSGIYGSPIMAAADGVVILKGFNDGGYGNYVMIYHGTASDGKNYTTLYGHMASSAIVNIGDSVKAGQTIGYVGSTGRSSGPHLHFEIRVGKGWSASPVNPMNYF